MGWFSILKSVGHTYPSPKYTTFMVHNNVWDSANMVNNAGGIRELEMSLGRELTEKDFTNAPVNWIDSYWDENRAKTTYPPIINITPDERNADSDSIKRKKEILGKEGRKKLARMYLNSTEWQNRPTIRGRGEREMYIKEAKKIIGVD